MEQILDKIDRLKADFDALLPIDPAHQTLLDKKFRLEFNYNSNHMEGNTLTYSETELLLFFDDTKGNHTMREYEEMKAHDVAYHLVQQWAKDPQPLSEVDIKNLNKTLLVRPYWKEAITPDGQDTRRQILVGEYKQQPNSVRLANGEIFEYASPIETPAKMQELMAWFHKTQADDATPTHPLILAAMLHYRFVCIHPFDDGNGRVSRLLMNYVLLKHNFPPVIIKSADKANYLRALRAADAGDLAEFVRYIGAQLAWSLELSIQAAKGQSIEEPDDLDKEIALLQRSLSGREKLEVARSDEHIVALFENSFIGLFQGVEEKLSVLSGSFFSVQRRLLANMTIHYTTFDVTHAGKDWSRFIRWVNRETMINNKQMNSFRYSYELEGLKNSIAAPVFEAVIEIKFNQYNYTILGQLYPYGTPLSEDQKQAIIRTVVKEVVDRIKATNE